MRTQTDRPHMMYLASDDLLHIVAQPNTLILGDPGTGKTSLVKCLLKRSGAAHWVGIIDPRGEYGAFAEELGLETVALSRGGSARLNPLDGGPGASLLGAAELAARRVATIGALIGCALGRSLTALEDAAVVVAASALPISAGRRQPELRDVAHLLASSTTAMAEQVGRSEHEMAEGLHEARAALARILDQDLRGVCDGASTVRADCARRGLVLDLSALGDPDGLRLATLASAAWLESATACPESPDTARRCVVIDEGWVLVSDEHSAHFLERWWQQSELYGVTTVVTSHRLSDVDVPGIDRAAQAGAVAARAARMLTHVPARVIMRQSSPDEVELTRTTLGLTGAEALLVPRLQRGQGLWAVEGRTAIVQHVIAPDEWRFCESGSPSLLV